MFCSINHPLRQNDINFSRISYNCPVQCIIQRCPFKRHFFWWDFYFSFIIFKSHTCLTCVRTTFKILFAIWPDFPNIGIWSIDSMFYKISEMKFDRSSVKKHLGSFVKWFGRLGVQHVEPKSISLGRRNLICLKFYGLMVQSFIEFCIRNSGQVLTHALHAQLYDFF